MKRKLWIPAAVLVIVASLGFALVAVSSGDAKSTAAAKKRAIYLTAVEWKGSAEVAKEPYPTAPLPEGGGYELIPPDATGKWATETYRFDSAVVVACEGEQVTMNIFGVNAAYHDITMPEYKLNFRVSRGQLSTVSFLAKRAGIFPIVCLTHKPSHRADLAVFRKGSGPC